MQHLFGALVKCVFVIYEKRSTYILLRGLTRVI